MQADTSTILNRILVRETSSLLQYLGASWPWTTDGGRATLARLERIVAEDQAAARALADYLSARKVPPQSGFFPEEFTSLNYLGLDKVLPRLAADQRSTIAALQGDAAALTDPEARALVDRLLAVKRRHLAELDQLAAHNEAAPASTLR